MVDSWSFSVGDYYDQVNELLPAMFTENIHFGYWPDPSGGDSHAEAGEWMNEQLFERLDASARHKVLDVGCGVGKPAVWLARKTGAIVKGVNISRSQLDIANARARSEGLQEQVSFEVADAMNLPYPDDSFDRVYALESMIHMPDRGQVLREMARVLRPGGRLAIADPALRGTLNDQEMDVVKRWGDFSMVRSVERMEDYPVLVKEAGLQLVELTDVSEHTRPTGAALLPAFDALLQSVGEDTGIVEAKKNWAELFTLSQFGYVLITALN